MSPRRRRVLQAVAYEALAVCFVAPAFALIFSESGGASLGLAIVISAIALAWNYIFNSLFERWEADRGHTSRTLLRRIAHAVGFEGGLVIALVPVMAWWLNISLLTALIADLGVLAFFFVYSFIFTWAFDYFVPISRDS